MVQTPEQKDAKKREKLLKELEALKITNATGTESIPPLTGQETNEQLAELLKKAKADAKAAEKAAAQPPQPPAPAKDAKEIVVKYRDHKGEETERSFSAEVHGPDFAKVAAEFQETNKSRIIGAELR